MITPAGAVLLAAEKLAKQKPQPNTPAYEVAKCRERHGDHCDDIGICSRGDSCEFYFNSLKEESK